MGHPNIPISSDITTYQSYETLGVTPTVPQVTLESGYDESDLPVDEDPIDTALLAAGYEEELGAPPEGVEFIDAPLSRQEIIDNFTRWQQDEPVPSQPAVVGKIAELTAAERDILKTMDILYSELSVGDLAHADSAAVQRDTELTETQLRIIHKLDEQFIAAVTRDISANGLGTPADLFSHFVQAGVYSQAEDSTGWHVDRFDSPAVRYVAAVGDAGATNFGVGMTSRSELFDHDVIAAADIRPEGKYELANHGAGAVSRFMANHGVHNSPTQPGFRIFFSISLRLPKSEQP